MDKIEQLIKEYLKGQADLGSAEKTLDCPDELILVEYLKGSPDKEKCQSIEHHLAGCGFCLSQLALASQAQAMDTQGSFDSVPQALVDKAKSFLGVHRNPRGLSRDKARMRKSVFFLAGAAIFFILSFIFPRYFIQFLVVTLILGIRWALESDGGRTLIMVLDSWRRHSHDDDDEVPQRLKDRYKSFRK